MQAPEMQVMKLQASETAHAGDVGAGFTADVRYN
jgi:hypothetical protein